MLPGTSDGVQTYSLPSAPFHRAAQERPSALDPPEEPGAEISRAATNDHFHHRSLRLTLTLSQSLE